MAKLQSIQTPVHGFSSPKEIKFKWVRITEKNFKEPDTAHKHSYWTVFVFLSGSIKHLIDFNEVPVKPNSIHFVFPGQIHALNGEGNDVLAYALIFTEDFFMIRDSAQHLLFKLLTLHDSNKAATFDIPEEKLQYFQHLLNLIEAEWGQLEKRDDQVLMDLLSAFIQKCGQLMENDTAKNPVKQNQYLSIRKAVEQNFRSIHTVAEYSTLTGIHTKTINDICREYTGMSALEFIHSRVITESLRLLKYGDKPIKEIAYLLNFTDAAHFSKFLKLKTGKTPMDIRNEKG